MKMTKTNIESIASQNNLRFETVISGVFSETEKLVVYMPGFKSIVFVMDNQTFDFTFEKAYNASTDKTTKRLPKIFRKKP